MTGRKCSTCKHFDPAPIWRKGWCRNPALYSSQQSHLVDEDALDCERGMGNYWEGSESTEQSQLNDAFTVLDRVQVAPLHLYHNGHEHLVSQSGRPVYPVSGSSDYRDDPPLDDAENGRGQPPRQGDRQLEYYSEERYWTDYLRIILPVAGLFLILVLLYLWALAFLRGDEEPTDQAGVGPTTTLPVITASPTETARVGATGTPRIVVTPPPIQPTQPGQTEPDPTTPPDEEEPVIEEPGDIYVGGLVRIANTAGEGANMRGEPTTDSGVIAVLLDNTELTVIGGPEEALGFTWWNVEGDAGSGWVVENYLVLIE